MEFKSNKLWTAFIDWEESQSNLRSVTEIYDQLILTPTQQYIKNWQKYESLFTFKISGLISFVQNICLHKYIVITKSFS